MQRQLVVVTDGRGWWRRRVRALAEGFGKRDRERKMKDIDKIFKIKSDLCIR